MIFNNVYWIQLGCLVFSGVSALLYLFVIATVFVYWKKEPIFRSVFFRLWISLGITDLIHGIPFWFTSKIPPMGYFSSFYLNAGKQVAGILMFWAFASLLGQVFGTILVTVNRFTAIFYPFQNERVWSKKGVLPALISVSWVLSFGVAVPIAFMDMNWEQLDNHSKVAFHFFSAELSGAYMLGLSITLNMVCAVIFILYILMICKLLMRSKKNEQKSRNDQHHEKNRRKQEIKLAICAFFQTVFLIFYSVSFLLFALSGSGTITLCDNAIIVHLACDLNTFTSVYLLLSTSTVVRNRVGMLAKLLFCCSNSGSQVQPAHQRTSVQQPNGTQRTFGGPSINTQQFQPRY